VAGHDHHIPSCQFVLAQPETLPAGPFEAIARHRIARGFNGDRKPQAGMVQAIRSGQNDQPRIALSMTFCAQGRKLTRPGQSTRWRETPLSHVGQYRSDGQAMTALGTPGLDDQTTVLGRHPGTKPMGALTTQFAGLVGSFHGVNRCSGK
jgi:hypothetical protein